MNGVEYKYLGMPVVVSDALPTHPGELEDVRRRVRHGLADVIEWCGDAVGPKPGEPTHAILMNGRLHVSRVIADKLASEARS